MDVFQLNLKTEVHMTSYLPLVAPIDSHPIFYMKLKEKLIGSITSGSP
jgi:hypothetical protein